MNTEEAVEALRSYRPDYDKETLHRIARLAFLEDKAQSLQEELKTLREKNATNTSVVRCGQAFNRVINNIPMVVSISLALLFFSAAFWILVKAFALIHATWSF